MSRLRDDLRSTAESIAQDAERLADVEREKTARRGDDPALPALAEEADALSEQIGRKIAAENHLVEQLGEAPRPA